MGDAQFLQIPFGGGMDQKQAQEYLDPNSKQVSITNGNFTKVGAIDKRLGIGYLSNNVIGGSQPQPTTGTRAFSWSRSGLSIASEGSLYSYSPAESGLCGIAGLPQVYPLRTPITATPSAAPPVLLDIPYNAGLLRLALTYDLNGNVTGSVSDADTGDQVLEPTIIYTPSDPSQYPAIILQPMYLPNGGGTPVCILIKDTQTGNIYGIHYIPSANEFVTYGAIVANAGAADAVPYVNDPNGGFIVFFASSSTVMTMQYFGSNFGRNSSFNLPTIPSGSLEFPCYACATYGEHVWLIYSYYDGTDYHYLLGQYSGDYNFTQQVAPGAVWTADTNEWIIGTLTRVSANVVFFNRWKQNPGVGNSNAVNGNWYTFNGSSVNAHGPTPYGYLPAMRAFCVNGVIYQACIYTSLLTSDEESSDEQSLQNTLYLMQYYGGLTTTTSNIVLPIATIAPRQLNIGYQLIYLLYSLGHLPLMSNTHDLNATRFGMGLKTNGVDIGAFGGPQGPSWAVDFYFDAASLAKLYQPGELGGEVTLSGGVPFVTDAQTAFEDSFFYYPEWLFGNLVGSGCGLVGSYSYAVNYMYVDAAGLIHRGSPVITQPFTLPGSGDSGVQLSIPTYSATWRDQANPGEVFAEIYRTTSDGTTFYLIDRISVSNLPVTEVVKWPVGTNVFDNFSDADIATATLLYTTGGVLDNVNPPSFPYFIIHRDRKAGVDETLQNVWFSKKFIPGEAPGFNEALIIPFPDGGNITALGSLDANFIVFKQSSIWYMTGDGPAQTGQGSDWSIPTRIASDVGCIEWRSVVLTPVGLMFQSPNGIYLLGRDLSVSWIGKNVIDITTEYPTINSAVLVPDSTQVRFTATNGSSSITIVYDYYLQQWTTHTYSYLTAQVASATLTYDVPQQYTILTTDGNIWQEELPTATAPYFDTDSSSVQHFVPTTITCAWVKLQGIQAYNRLRRIMFYGDQQDQCGMAISLAINYQPTIEQTYTYPYNALSSLPIPGQVEMHVAGAYNKQFSIQATFSDVAGGAGMVTGQGMRFVAAGFEILSIGERYRQIPPLGRS